jgi:hypothetical protein
MSEFLRYSRPPPARDRLTPTTYATFAVKSLWQRSFHVAIAPVSAAHPMQQEHFYTEIRHFDMLDLTNDDRRSYLDSCDS